MSKNDISELSGVIEPSIFTKPNLLKQSKNKELLDKWNKNGGNIPTCINYNCDRPVAIRHWSAQGDPSLKTECSRCSSARCAGKSIEGVTFHKKHYCENKDSILGWVCPMDQSRYAEFPSDIYEMDHKDGNHHNNTPENLVTLCSICHTRKAKNLATSIHKGNHQESNKKTLNHIIKGVGVFILLLFL